MEPAVKNSGLVAAALVASLFCTAPLRAADTQIGDKVMKLTRATVWKQVAAVPVAFPTFHPQGMFKLGDAFFFSTVDIQKPTTRFPAPQDGYDRDTGAGQGHLFKMSADGRLLGDLKLGEGSVFHPGGIDFDGRFLWVPVAEYRPNSQSIIYKVDPETMTAVEAFRFADHIGGIAYNSDAKSLHGVSWGSRRFYRWPLGADGKISNAGVKPEALRVLNPAQYIDYQDCHYVGRERMLCSGLNAYKTAPNAVPFQLGGFEIVDLRDDRPLWQVPVELWSPSGLPMTQNPFFVEATATGLRAHFMPDDDKSVLFIYEAEVR